MLRLLVVVAAVAGFVQAYPGGAPTYVCDTMVPTGHVDANNVAYTPQNPTRPIPYKVTTNGTIQAGVPIRIRIEKDGGNDFKGFFLVVKNGAPTNNQPNSDYVLGSFTRVSSGGQNGQTTNCPSGGASGNAITHDLNVVYSQVEYDYTPPAASVQTMTNPTIWLTVVENKATFWTPVTLAVEVDTGTTAGAAETTKAADGATTQAADGATTQAADGATTQAADGATTKATDDATTKAGDGATTKAGDDATTKAEDGATTKATDDATTTSDMQENGVGAHTVANAALILILAAHLM